MAFAHALRSSTSRRRAFSRSRRCRACSSARSRMSVARWRSARWQEGVQGGGKGLAGAHRRLTGQLRGGSPGARSSGRFWGSKLAACPVTASSSLRSASSVHMSERAPSSACAMPNAAAPMLRTMASNWAPRARTSLSPPPPAVERATSSHDLHSTRRDCARRTSPSASFSDLSAQISGQSDNADSVAVACCWPVAVVPC
mmetsp:Transcript_37013/g.110617  ORF Transcript_37013/g.110617 Transcript_37013/m.110617 type:complete len:200 (-) Transcript_37013:1306-1905(-)